MSSPDLLPWIFLAVSLVGAGFTAAALRRPGRLHVFVVPYFLGAWLTSELAMHHLAWQAVATVAFVAAGALRAWPGVVGLAVTFASWAGLVELQRRAARAGEAYRTAFSEGVAVPAVGRETAGRVVRPFAMRHPEVERVRDIAYDDAHPRHRLDVYRPRVRDGLRPTLLQIHGGGWVIGRKDQQALPLMHHLASRGWVCVAANYRLSPRATFPDQLVDVKRALAWIRRHGASYGADPEMVLVTGGSAGGHLAALVALTAGDPSLQPGFEDVDTSVAACIPFYGIYDFLDRHGVRGRESMRPFLERTVMKCAPEREPERWEAASPIAQVHAGAPPFFVIHGTHDALAPVEDARHFVRRLRETSRQPVLYAELPGAQHAFETFHSLRTRHTLRAVTHFAEQVVAGRQRDAESGAWISTMGTEPVVPVAGDSSVSETPTAAARAANEWAMPRTK